MKKLLFSFLSILALAACRQIEMPVHRGEVMYDTEGKMINAHGAGVMLHEGTYYLFGEHKTAGKAGNVAHVGVHCYSSKDLKAWKDEGVALSVAPEGSGSPIEDGCILERPKVVFNAKTGKFVMWFHLEPKGKGYLNAHSGVAVSDSPAGPYTFLHEERPDAGFYPVNDNELFHQPSQITPDQTFPGDYVPAHPDSLNIIGCDLAGGQQARDMTIFLDDDGKAYHIYSSEWNSTLHISELSEDFTSHSGRYARAFAGRFMEAPAMFKRNGKYYLMMSGCTGWAPNAARSAVADNIFGPWTELGNPCTCEGAETTYGSQSTFVLQLPGTDRYLYMGDRWCPDNAEDGRYLWLPIRWEGERFLIDY